MDLPPVELMAFSDKEQKEFMFKFRCLPWIVMIRKVFMWSFFFFLVLVLVIGFMVKRETFVPFAKERPIIAQCAQYFHPAFMLSCCGLIFFAGLEGRWKRRLRIIVRKRRPNASIEGIK